MIKFVYVLALLMGILVLLFPKFLRYILGAYLILVGVIGLLGL